MNQNESNNEVDFSINGGGPLDRGLDHTGLNKPSPAQNFSVYVWRHWRFIIWSNLLRRTAKLNLQLFPKHLDRAGTLSFVGLIQAKFAVIVLVSSAVSRLSPTVFNAAAKPWFPSSL